MSVFRFTKRLFFQAILSITVVKLTAQIPFAVSESKPFFTQRVYTNDTTLDELHNFFPLNALGNNGLNTYDLIFKPNHKNLGFNWYPNFFGNTFFTPESPVSFQSYGIYTKVSASAGQKQEQVLKFIHAQNFKNGINISLQFNRFSSLGFFNSQKSYQNNLAISSSLNEAKYRLGYRSYFIFNKVKSQLNGGIKNDSLFAENLLVEKNQFQVNLIGAKSSYRNISAGSTVWFKLNSKSDTAKNHYLDISGHYTGNYFLYSDLPADSAFYPSVLHPSASGTKDSMHVYVFEGGLHYRVEWNSRRNNFQLGYMAEKANPSFYRFDTTLISHYARMIFELQSKNKNFSGDVMGKYGISGFKSGAWQVLSHLNFNIAADLTLRNTLTFQSDLPEYFYLRYDSKYFGWKKNPVMQDQFWLESEFNSRKYKAAVLITAGGINSPWYFDSNCNPVRYNGNVQLISGTIRKDLKIFHVHFNNLATYQKTNSTEVFPLPEWYVKSQLYYEGKLFKSNLWLQAGIQAVVFSEFYSRNFIPALGIFAYQNKVKSPTYPYCDLFINAEIKPVRFFIKLEHLNQGLTGNYFITPSYPIGDRALKAGLVWVFRD